MDHPRKALRSRSPSQKPISLIASEQARADLNFGAALFHPEAPVLLVRLQEFAAAVTRDGFELTANALIGPETQTETVLELVSALSEALDPEPAGNERDIFKKSLQEMFFYATDVEHQVDRLEFGKRLQTSIKRIGSKGWIRLFLSLQVANAVRIRLGNGQLSRDLNAAIEEIAENAVRSSMAPYKKWTEMTPAQARALIKSVKANIGTTPLSRWTETSKASSA